MFSSGCRKLSQGKRRKEKLAVSRRGVFNLPDDVATCLDPVVEHGKASIGDEVGEAHGCELLVGLCVEGGKGVVVWGGRKK
jgi:hypothetical protein